SLDFQGAYLSTAQWYLIILGAWLVATGGFLVYRFLGLRKGYEERQRRQAEEARVLAEARAAAEQASSAKSQFLANMSHELRTPLNAIIGYAALLKDSELSEKQISAIRTIQQSGEHLLTMITDILDIAKVEAGKLELLPGAFDIRACVMAVAQMIALRAQEKGLAFAVVIDDAVPYSVFADQKRVRQVLINLLVNAVKFTSAGEVRLTGVGIAHDHIDRIFRPFEQAGNSIDRSGGTGLGLAITHQIVTMMDGAIGVESRLGEGSCFRVEITFALAQGAARLPEPGEPAPLPQPETDEGEAALVAPAGEALERLLVLARAGNLRAIRKEIPAIKALGPQYLAFAERLDALAAAYQSPAVLRLIEHSAQERTAA
ncbi:MAG: hypothetical protein JF615_17280, partial [Asticcacaulis sp.]|nr:hypothetical protein [Asticcacaulis sp.]